MRIYLVAGELSGDILGASLMRALKTSHPDVEFRGIGGPRMQAEGFESLYPLETLSIMGLVEVLKHLPELIKVRRHLLRDALEWQPDVMIGIDAPDFNLGLELRLRKRGITTAHYVSPSVWAWRQGRVKTIHRAVDRMLTFLPFEAAFYREHQVPVTFVGHPLADELPLQDDCQAARLQLGIDPSVQLLAVLPGSRGNEIRFLGETFLSSIERLCARYPELEVVIPAATPLRRTELEALMARRETLDHRRIHLVDGQSREAMTAADAVLLASGTAALECLLCHRPMVVAYRMAPMTHRIARYMVKTEWISLPNLIARETLVPELIQDAATPESIEESLAPLLSRAAGDVCRQRELRERFIAMHRELTCDASAAAASAIGELAAR